MISLSQLASLTKLYLLQEYAPTDRIFSERESYLYFRDLAAKRQPQAPQPVKITAPILSQPMPAVIAPQIKAVVPPPPPKPIEKPAILDQLKAPKILALLEPERETKKVVKEEPHFFQLDVPQAPTKVDFADLRKIIGERLPNVVLLGHVPDDAEARQRANLWQQKVDSLDVLIVSFDEIPKHQMFLMSMAKTLERQGLNISIVKAEKFEEKHLQSSSLRLVIASTHGMHSFPDFKKHYREEPKQARHYLGSVPLLLLGDLAFYLKEPMLKQPLWKAIKELLGI